jgi:hypothetical protein
MGSMGAEEFVEHIKPLIQRLKRGAELSALIEFYSLILNGIGVVGELYCGNNTMRCKPTMV